jgi:hypothetical protein
MKTIQKKQTISVSLLIFLIDKKYLPKLNQKRNLQIYKGEFIDFLTLPNLLRIILLITESLK